MTRAEANRSWLVVVLAGTRLGPMFDRQSRESAIVAFKQSVAEGDAWLRKVR